jgi:hypothetical protein
MLLSRRCGVEITSVSGLAIDATEEKNPPKQRLDGPPSRVRLTEVGRATCPDISRYYCLQGLGLHFAGLTGAEQASITLRTIWL